MARVGVPYANQDVVTINGRSAVVCICPACNLTIECVDPKDFESFSTLPYADHYVREHGAPEESVAETIKDEIKADLKATTRNRAGLRMTAGRIKRFEDLHKFVDANEYGETHPAVIAAHAAGDVETLCALKNGASAIVDEWLRFGDHKA